MFTRRSRRADALDDRLRAVASRRSGAGIFCDFDGSLSPIVADPSAARPVRGASRVLHALARHFGLVAVISGRPVSFLARRLHARGVRLVGLYGVEERIGRTLDVLPEVRAARARVDDAAAALRDALRDEAGVFVEHKGYALSVHFRRAPDPAQAAARAEPIVHAIAAAAGLSDVARGKMVLEVRPPVAVDKGAVVRRLVDERDLTAAVVIGDDAGDIPMFDALSGCEPVVRVVVESEETPLELLARADLRVPDPYAVVRLLRALNGSA